MTYLVSITSQGQISIPIQLRRKFGLEKTQKAIVSDDADKIIIEPVQDFLELKGSLKTKIKKTPRQIRRAFEEYLAQEAIKGLR
ncbi:AbrB/MazE/SpoVT family DNA-binding domain-containing protein [Candidatus Daviesbacteria bacterium]|nr:AbrB/MazE/SpoVT family DNA-binding domain-containing protein [Candidatus Daviesbacteria bacterium]